MAPINCEPNKLEKDPWHFRKILFDWMSARLQKYLGLTVCQSTTSDEDNHSRSVALAPISVNNLNSAIILRESR